MSVRNLVRGAAVVAAVAMASAAQAAVVTIEHNPTNGYTTIGAGDPTGTTATAGFGTIANYPTEYISEALLTIYLADDDQYSNDEYVGFTTKAGAGAWVDIANATYLKSANLVYSSDGSGTYEVDGKQCPYGTLKSDSRCKNYYDSYVFNVTNLIKEGQTFSLSIFETDNDSNDSFWYKGSLLTYTTTRVTVPEPATLGLLGLGLIGFGLARRRRIAA